VLASLSCPAVVVVVKPMARPQQQVDPGLRL